MSNKKSQLFKADPFSKVGTNHTLFPWVFFKYSRIISLDFFVFCLHIYVPQGQVELIKDMLPEDLGELVVEQPKEVVEQTEEVGEPPMFLN